MKASGSCLCGGLKYEILASNGEIYQCHCSICRKATGSSANANLVVRRDDFRWSSEPESLEHYKVTDTWTAAFCAVCGSKAPCIDSDNDIYYVPAGGLEDDARFQVVKHIYVGSKAKWDEIGGSAEKKDKM